MCVPRQQGSVGGRSLPNSWFRCTPLTHASFFFLALELDGFSLEEGEAGARQTAP